MENLKKQEDALQKEVTKRTGKQATFFYFGGRKPLVEKQMKDGKEVEICIDKGEYPKACIAYLNVRKLVFVGVSIACQSDRKYNFNKRLGRVIALGRLLKGVFSVKNFKMDSIIVNWPPEGTWSKIPVNNAVQLEIEKFCMARKLKETEKEKK